MTVTDRSSEDEDRWITMGQTPEGKLLIVNHTYRKAARTELVRTYRQERQQEMKQSSTLKGELTNEEAVRFFQSRTR
jgi:uncharacterized DUF497 family protein